MKAHYLETTVWKPGALLIAIENICKEVQYVQRFTECVH